MVFANKLNMKMIKYQSQNNETNIALKYFKGRKGNILDIGANTGYFLSNSYDLIKEDWFAVLVEPSSAFEELETLYKGNKHVELHNIALGKKDGKLKFYESGAHIKGGNDKALVSTAIPKEMERWSEVDFNETEVNVMSVTSFLDCYKDKKFNYISLDVEGMEWEILQLINLKQVGCEFLCVEWNGNKDLEKKFTSHCGKYGLKEISRNAENLIFAIP